MAATTSFLRHANYKWLKNGLWLTAIAIVAYVAWDPIGGRNGGTAVGYGLGGVGAALILWLSWLGVRKRSFASKRRRFFPQIARRLAANPEATLRGWTSAHVYLGLALLVLATLHTGFEFGWNIHTLAYALMVLVILSGILLIIAYASIPDAMSENLAGESPERVRKRVEDADAALARLATRLPDAFAGPVRRALRETRIGGGPIALLSGSHRNCAASRALSEANAAAATDHGANPKDVSDLISALALKAKLTRTLRRDAALKARMEGALWIHVPVTIALIAALTAHVISVFFYW